MSAGSLAYSEALSGALWDAASALPDAAWRYRGVSLRRAAVCEAYFALRDDPQLQAAFANGANEVPPQRTPFLQAAVSRLLGRRSELTLLARAERGARTLGANLRHLGRRARAEGAARPLTTQPALLIQIRHPKHARTLAPILGELLERGVEFAFGLSAMSAEERAAIEADLRERGWPARCVPWRHQALPGLAGPALWSEPRLTCEFDAHLAELDALRPRVLLLVEGNARQDALAAAAARLRGVPVLCLQHGWPPRLHAGFRRLEVDAFLVWGAGFGRLLLPFNPGLRSLSVGNALLPERTARAPSAGRDPVFFLQSAVHGITGAAFESFLRLIETTARERPVWVRAHPSYLPDHATRSRLEALENVRWRNAPEPLAAILAEARLTAAIHSTTIHESAAAGVLPLVFRVEGVPALQPDVVAAGAGLAACSLEEALALVRRAATDGAWLDGFAPAMRAFRADYFAAGGQAAARLAAEAILSCAREGGVA